MARSILGTGLHHRSGQLDGGQQFFQGPIAGLALRIGGHYRQQAAIKRLRRLPLCSPPQWPTRLCQWAGVAALHGSNDFIQNMLGGIHQAPGQGCRVA